MTVTTSRPEVTYTLKVNQREYDALYRMVTYYTETLIPTTDKMYPLFKSMILAMTHDIRTEEP